MSELGESIARLRLELGAELSGARLAASGAEVIPSVASATVTLGLVREPSGAWRLARPEAGEVAAHTLTLTLQPADFPVAPFIRPEGVAIPVTEAPLAAIPASGVYEALVRVLGQPGFDTSARAEVLGEWLQSCPLPDALQVLDWCRADSTSVPDQPARGAWNRVRRILSFSPNGASAAAVELQRLLQLSSVETILEVLGSRWKFGTHWSPSTDSASAIA